MKFRNKILFAIWGVVLGLIVLTFVIMNYWMRVQVQDRFSDDLRRNYSTLHEITTLRADQDLKSSQIIAETPRLKAVTELGDRNTAVQLAKELNTGILANLFVIMDSSGKPLVDLVDNQESAFSAIDSISFALKKNSREDVWRIGTDVYRVASSPIVVGTDFIGTLTIGFRIKSEDIAFIKTLTNSEVLLAVDDRQILSTYFLNGVGTLAQVMESEKPSRTPPQMEIHIGKFESAGESFLAVFYRLDRNDSPDHHIGYLLFKPIEKEIDATLTPVLNTLIALSFLFLAITAVIGYVISKSITKPIAALVQGTTEVSRGNYDVKINVKTGGELKFLARKFEEMGLSLRENIDQLGKQNVELQTTLRQLKETQEERLRLATNLHLLLESTGEGIFGIDVDGICTFINRSGALMLGFGQQEIVGKNIHELTHHRHPDGSPFPYSACPISKVLKTGVGCRIDDDVMWRRDRTTLPVEYASSPIIDGGKIQGAVVTFTDVTERRMLQQQLMQTQKIESIGILAGGIAHDFNNILTIIMGHAVVLRRIPADSPKRQESVEAITKASQRGAGLVRQLLTFARKTDVTLESVRLNEVITEVANLLNETFPKTIIVSMQLENDLPAMTADANQLHQVLVNLCVNARDAMPDGGMLSITTKQVPAEKLHPKFSKISSRAYAEISIADSGTGMDEQTLNRIFEPFFTTKGVGKGTGLGLAVVFGIVETHKGFIDVESTIRKGTTFHLYFPLPRIVVDHAMLMENDIQEIPGGSETLLFVEDEEMVQELINGVLSAKGYTVLIAGDGEEMVQTYLRRQEDIDLVISDMGLPKLGGFEAMKKIKAINPRLKVILASGYLEPNVKSEIFKAGATEFIQKPYLPDEVLKKVRDVLNQS